MKVKKIVIVEDERLVAIDIKSTLETLGYTVPAIAASGETALKKVAETQPELVLMDIHLKGNMDGVETAQQIRNNFNLPVIYLTANADNTTVQRAKVTEPYGYILKPFEEKELNISIEMAIYKHQKESSVKASEPTHEAIQTTKVRTSSKTTIDDIALIETFVQNFIQGQPVLLHNPNLKTEHVGDTIQLIGKTAGLVVKGMLTEKPRSALVKRNSRYWELIHQAMFANSFLPVGQIQTGVYRYQHRLMPQNYQMHCTNALELQQVWSEEKNRNQNPGIPMDIIMLKQGTWNPIIDITYNNYDKTLYVKTLGDKIVIDQAEMLVWGKKLSN